MPNYEIAFVDNNGIPVVDGTVVTVYPAGNTSTVLEVETVGVPPANTGQGTAYFTTLSPNITYQFALSGISGYRTVALPNAPEIVVPLGVTGATGPAGPAGSIGQGLTWSGTWNSVSTFQPYDVCYYQGSAYIAVAESLNAVPGVSPDWQLIASQGAAGANGTNGATGATGPSGASFIWDGTWNSGTTYVTNDVVYYNGSSYVSLVSPNTNNNPSSSPTDWALMAVGSGSTITTGPVTSSGSGASVTIPVANGLAFPNLSYIVLSDGTNVIFAQITAGGGTTSLTATVAYPVSAVTVLSNATATFGGPLVNSFNFYDISGQFNGSVTASTIMQTIVAGRAFKFISGIQSNHAYCVTAPTNPITFTIARNGIQFGTVTFASGGTTGNVTITTTTQFNSGDVLTVTTQSASDATFANVAYTIAGVVM